ncbi:response regulator [uncultured Pseudodesulfovibrio sp.]|uniref:response regulator n=1 Tax=uncultured Pseudodesulfovibrio sp. TaxID=2035858 RepID=UPI0029C60C6C|nr:response regulator [uncultured Pseudodesulfovibrio sp.]
MIAITVFNGLYCSAHQVVEEMMHATGYRLVTDQEVIADAAKLSGMDEDVLAGVFPSEKYAAKSRSSYNGEAVGWLRLAMAYKLSERRNLIFHGYSALLLPPKMQHVLRVCLVSEIKERMLEGARAGECPEHELRDHIFANDLARANWVMTHTDSTDPWDECLYDLVLPVASQSARQSACRVMELLCKVAAQNGDSSRESLDDFLLSAKVQVNISHWGNCVSVTAKGDSISLSFNEHEKTLSEVNRDLCDLVSGLDGVKSVYVCIDRLYNQADVHCMPRRRPPSRNRANSSSGGGAFDLSLCESSGRRREDFALAARVHAVLARDGYPISVYADDGAISLAIMSHATMLQVVARKLCSLVSRIDGVKNVEVGLVQTYHKTPAYSGLRQRMASRILLEDDRKFPLSLPECLRTRDHISIAVYDGETVLSDNNERKPEIVLLDADLPGLDGIEAVRRVRLNNPEAKLLVISDRERDDYMNMGVSAYLHKPVTAAVLGDAIRGAAAGTLYSSV